MDRTVATKPLVAAFLPWIIHRRGRASEQTFLIPREAEASVILETDRGSFHPPEEWQSSSGILATGILSVHPHNMMVTLVTVYY